MTEEKRGRKTKEQEAWAFLAELGVDEETVEKLKAAKSGKTPESFAEMRDLAAAQLWADYSSLQGVAKVQAFKAIQSLAKDDPGGGDDKDEPLIGDILNGIALLPVERRDEILNRELVRLDEERAAILGVLNGERPADR